MASLDQDRANRDYVDNFFKLMRSVVENLRQDEVPYFNLGRRTITQAESTRSATSMRHYSMRPLGLNTGKVAADYQSWALFFPSTRIRIELHQHLAYVPTRKKLSFYTAGRLPAPGDTAVPPPAPQEEEPSTQATSMIVSKSKRSEPQPPTSTSTDDEESAPVPMSEPTFCGSCKKDDVPMSLGAIKNRIYRKKWICCYKGAECKSTSCWYHIKDCSDVDLNVLSQAGHRRHWVCFECRKNWDAAAEGRPLYSGRYCRIRNRR